MKKKSLAFKKKLIQTSDGTPPSTQSKSKLAVPRLLEWNVSSLHLHNFQIGSIADEQQEVDEEHEEEGGEEEKEDEEEEKEQDNEEEQEQEVDIENEAAVEQIAEEADSDELEERVRFLQDNCEKLEAQIKALEIENSELVDKCGKLEEENVIHEAHEGQIRVLEIQNSEFEKQMLLCRLELNEECQRRKTVEYEKTKMTREKDAEIELLKQRIKQYEKIDIEAEHILHRVTQQWKQKQQKQSSSTSTEVSKQVHLKKRKADSDVNKGAKEAGQTEPYKKRKLSKSGPVFRYLTTESQKKLTTFWESASTTDSLWAGNHYETSIYADEVSHIMEQEAIANSTIDAYAEILLANYPKSRCMILSTRWLYLEGKANEKTRWKMYNDDLETVLQFDFVIFPIHEDDHWTLLVLKVLKGTWCFYDSMQVQRNQSSSKCKAATNIQKRVTAYLKQRWERFPIESTVRIEPGCPQQPPGSDCGIIVCKIMKHFVLNEEFQDTISHEECNEIRAEILEAFIADEDRSWQSQEL